MKKGFTGKKTCKDGEIYTFKNGIAIVPGFLLFRKPVLITLAQFKEINNDGIKSTRNGKVATCYKEEGRTVHG